MLKPRASFDPPFITQTKIAAAIAFGSLTNLKSDLQALKRLLPLFLINKITKEVCENKAEELINNQDHFWEKYINFLDNYPTDAAQIANIRLIYPAYEVYQEMTFAQQVNHIKEKSPLMLQISNPDAENLVPENIEGLSATYEDIIATLTKIGGLEDNRNVKNERKSKIITKDVDDLSPKLFSIYLPLTT